MPSKLFNFYLVYYWQIWVREKDQVLVVLNPVLFPWPKKWGIFWEPISWHLNTSSVSYTHLDVYKRQGLLQSITLTNHPLLHQRINEGALRWSEKYKSNSEDLIRNLYLSLLCRLPDKKEMDTMINFLNQSDRKTGIEDMIWALLVSAEFQIIWE